MSFKNEPLRKARLVFYLELWSNHAAVVWIPRDCFRSKLLREGDIMIPQQTQQPERMRVPHCRPHLSCLLGQSELRSVCGHACQSPRVRAWLPSARELLACRPGSRLPTSLRLLEGWLFAGSVVPHPLPSAYRPGSFTLTLCSRADVPGCEPRWCLFATATTCTCVLSGRSFNEWPASH